MQRVLDALWSKLPFVTDLTVEPAQLDNAGLLGAAHQAWTTLR